MNFEHMTLSRIRPIVLKDTLEGLLSKAVILTPKIKNNFSFLRATHAAALRFVNFH